MNGLQHAIAILETDPEYIPEAFETASVVLSSCLGLLVQSKSNETVDFVHLTARKFIVDQMVSQTDYSNIAIIRACLRYMAVPEMSQGPCQSLEELKRRTTGLPFLEYAVRFYGYHVIEVENDMLSELTSFLDNEQ